MKIIRNQKAWEKHLGSIYDENVNRAVQMGSVPRKFPFGVVRFNWGRVFLVFFTLKDAKRLFKAGGHE